MKYVIHGAGAIGGIIGARLFEKGHEVALIARGDHLEQINKQGLEVSIAGERRVVTVKAYGRPHEIAFDADDVVLLCMKSQDVESALLQLQECAPEEVAVVCLQNGTEAERRAIRRFPNVYGASVFLPATYLHAGSVECFTGPTPGMVDLGRFPSGLDAVAEQCARDLNGSGISSRAVPDIMRWKYAKLLMNLTNAVEAACGPEALREHPEIGGAMRGEAETIFEASSIDTATAEETSARRKDVQMRGSGGARRGGGSSWQSAMRETGSSEADFLNGEVVLLGRLAGIPAPMNEAVRRVSNHQAKNKLPPGSILIQDVQTLYEQLTQSPK